MWLFLLFGTKVPCFGTRPAWRGAREWYCGTNWSNITPQQQVSTPASTPLPAIGIMHLRDDAAHDFESGPRGRGGNFRGAVRGPSIASWTRSDRVRDHVAGAS